MTAGDDAATRRLEIEAELDRRGVEALLVEIRLLGRQYGVEVSAARVEMHTGEASAGQVSA